MRTLKIVLTRLHRPLATHLVVSAIIRKIWIRSGFMVLSSPGSSRRRTVRSAFTECSARGFTTGGESPIGAEPASRLDMVETGPADAAGPVAPWVGGS